MSGLKTLMRVNHWLSSSQEQINILSRNEEIGIPSFAEKLAESGLAQLKPVGIDVFQVNVGKMCNQICKHCHVDAGPDRKEIMSQETMKEILLALSKSDVTTVDLTGGAPEMNPHFRWFVRRLTKMKKKIIVRCNLTIILANPKYHDLPEFFKSIRSTWSHLFLPFTARRTNAQRGDGVFEKSIKALKMLNDVGYGEENSNLKLDLVYNPSGVFLPDDQEILKSEYKSKLKEKYKY